MSRASSQRAEQLMKQLGLRFNHILAIRFAVNVGIATWIVWTILKLLGLSNPVWAIVSTIACSDPQPAEAGKMFVGRLVNAIVGCSIGLLFLLINGSMDWILPVAMATTVLISSFLIRIKTMWLQAPITAALVIAASIGDPAHITAMNSGFRRVEDVIIGSCVGLTVSWIMSKLWFIQHQPEATAPMAPMQD